MILFGGYAGSLSVSTSRGHGRISTSMKIDTRSGVPDPGHDFRAPGKDAGQGDYRGATGRPTSANTCLGYTRLGRLVRDPTDCAHYLACRRPEPDRRVNGPGASHTPPRFGLGSLGRGGRPWPTSTGRGRQGGAFPPADQPAADSCLDVPGPAWFPPGDDAGEGTQTVVTTTETAARLPR